MQLVLIMVPFALQECVHSFIAPSKAVPRIDSRLKSDISDAIIAETAAVDNDLRFSGVGRLYANKQSPQSPKKETIISRLNSATVAVIGLGGVGSWAAEALVRSGVGNIVLIDLDDICISNTNRQLHAMSSTVGKMKIDEMKRRLVDINPGCNVTLIHDFVTAENANAIIQSLQPQLTAVIDAIDGMYEKTALILSCVANQIPIVTCGGAAGRMDPTKVIIDDLTKVEEDRLLFKCRKLMRQVHGFPKVAVPTKGRKERVRKWRIFAVYSTEVQQKVLQSEDEISFRPCDGSLGTACFLTGTYGFVAASKIVEMISMDEIVVPKRQPRQKLVDLEAKK